MAPWLAHYRSVWCVDFEFTAKPGERPEPLCMVAREWRTGDVLRLWQDELFAMDEAPFPTDAESLFVAYYASAELGCFLSLGWPFPLRVLDLYAEFRCLTNSQGEQPGRSLLAAMHYYGLDCLAATEKADMRALALRGGFYTNDERRALLDYCQTDVDALAKLLPAMATKIDLPRALLRGRYMGAVANMEAVGTPIDQELFERMTEHWPRLLASLARETNERYGAYVPNGNDAFDPATEFGRAVLEVSQAEGVDPGILAQCANDLAKQEREAAAVDREAIRAARKRIGLSPRRLATLDAQGKLDAACAMLPGFDTTAEEVASEFPELGLGDRFTEGTNFDCRDFGGLLLERLRQGAKTHRPRHDRGLLHDAAAMARDYGETPHDGPWRFSAERFAAYLSRENIPWPRLESGALDLSDDAFRERAKAYPQLAMLRELRHTLGEMRLGPRIEVGPDGRNRCLLSPFAARTGRNQPSNAKFIFGPSCWLRGLIKPAPGMAVAYLDWSQQEFGIAAALSHDAAMQAAYLSGDPYLEFAKQAGAVPATATKQTHKAERERFKACVLAVQYGMGAESLALRIDQPPAYARELLRLHRATYPRFWRWSDAAVNHAMLKDSLHAVFGWTVRTGREPNPRSLANFPCQANGAEMLRLACCLATEAGIRVCAPVHDALLIEANADEIDAEVERSQSLMAEASRIVLSGFELRSGAEIVREGDRYMDARGAEMWGRMLTLLEKIEAQTLVAESW